MHFSLYAASLRCLLFLCITVNAASCQLIWSPKSPKGYILPRPKKIILDKKLNETSGLFYLENENAMVSVADDKQKIYRITQDGKVNHYFKDDIGPQADFEDLVMIDSTVYVLVSNGTIIAVKDTGSGLAVQEYPYPSTGKNDFESIYYDSASKGLILLCKDCATDKGEDVRSAYRFHLAGNQFETNPYYTISNKAVRNQLKDGQVEFKPSAAAIHPLEQKLYILSSAGNLLVITDLKGVVQQVFRLNPTLYPQAEGITFAANGDMYITNEAKLGKPTLLYIPYKPSGK